MPRKSSKSTASKSASASSVEEKVAPSEITPAVEEQTSSVVEESTVSESIPSATHDSDDVAADAATGKSAQRSRKSVVEKIDHVLHMIEQGASPSAVTKQLTAIRKTLDGAQIKASKKSRKPNPYNLFMSEEMEKLKDVTDIPATEKFKLCIQKWNEKKENEKKGASVAA